MKTPFSDRDSDTSKRRFPSGMTTKGDVPTLATEPTAMNTPSSAPDAKRRALGRGLESLLPSRPAAPPQVIEMKGQPLEIALEMIERNPFQTRTDFDPAKLAELAQSIASAGVIQPITVRALRDGRYQLINGERRLRASQQAGKATIPAVVREVSDEQAMEMTIVENLQRADLNPMEQARAFQRLSVDFKMTQEQISMRTGKERASVGNFLRLLRLPEILQRRVELGELSFGHARTLLGLSTAEEMVHAAAKVVALAMSVRQTETYVHGLMVAGSKIAKADKVDRARKAELGRDPNVHEAQLKLQRRLGLRVRIEDRRGKGRVIIEYANLEDFDLLMGALGAQ